MLAERIINYFVTKKNTQKVSKSVAQNVQDLVGIMRRIILSV